MAMRLRTTALVVAGLGRIPFRPSMDLGGEWIDVFNDGQWKVEVDEYNSVHAEGSNTSVRLSAPRTCFH